MNSLSAATRLGALLLFLLAIPLHAQTPPAASINPSPDFAARLGKAQAGDAQAQYEVGAAYCDGNGVPRDVPQGREWLQKAADQHNIYATASLGLIYLRGVGVPADIPKGIALLQQADAKGNVVARRTLGQCYLMGVGLPKKPETAVHYLTDAADQGDLEAQTWLGLCYLQGLGVPRDPRKGFSYSLNAAYLDNGNAQSNVAACYANGVFVQRDPVLAYFWCKLASETYHDAGETNLLASLNASLTPEQRAQADELIRNWKKTKIGESQPPNLGFHFAASSRTTIPFTYKEGHILIQVHFPKRRALIFLVDTGSQMTMFDQALARGMNLVASNRYLPGSGVGKNLFLTSIFDNNTLELPGVTLDHLRLFAAPLDQWALGLDVHIDGVLGLDVLQRLVVRIDYIHKTLELISPSDFKGTEADATLPLTLTDQIALVEGVLTNAGTDSLPAPFVIDSGADCALTLGATFARANPALHLDSGLKMEAIGLGGVASQSELTCTQFRLGTLVLPSPAVCVSQKLEGVFLSRDHQAFLGNDILHRFDVTFDFPGKRLYLKKNSQFGDPYETSQTGLSVSYEPTSNTISVLDVLPNSPASRAGFAPGDVLVDLDGVELKTLDALEVRDRFRALGPHKVVVSRNGKPVPLDFLMDNSLRQRPAAPSPPPQ